MKAQPLVHLSTVAFRITLKRLQHPRTIALPYGLKGLHWQIFIKEIIIFAPPEICFPGPDLFGNDLKKLLRFPFLFFVGWEAFTLGENSDVACFLLEKGSTKMITKARSMSHESNILKVQKIQWMIGWIHLRYREFSKVVVPGTPSDNRENLYPEMINCSQLKKNVVNTPIVLLQNYTILWTTLIYNISIFQPLDNHQFFTGLQQSKPASRHPHCPRSDFSQPTNSAKCSTPC